MLLVGNMMILSLRLKNWGKSLLIGGNAMDEKQVAKEIRTAIKQGDADKVMSLIGSDKARLQMMTVFGTWLHVAASLGKLEIVKRLVELGADVNARGGIAGGTPLHEAASDGHLDIVRYLLSQRAEMDVSEPERNPLFGAIHGGHTVIAKLLIDSGIDTHVKYSGERMKDMDALAFAREWGREEIIALLISSESGPEAAPPAGLGRDKAGTLPEGNSRFSERQATRVDFDVLRQMIRTAARRAFEDVRLAHPDEHFYAFALYTTDDIAGVNPAANTEEGYARKRARYAAEWGWPEMALIGDFRWAPYSWKYECYGATHFREVGALINGNHNPERYDRSDPLGFVNFKAGVFASMVLALADLESEGYFGVGQARQALTVFCSVADSGCAPWLEADSARRLNPPGVFETFAAERIAYISDGPDDIPPATDSLNSAYLSHLRRGGCGA
jgi:hypothetical protein